MKDACTLILLSIKTAALLIAYVCLVTLETLATIIIFPFIVIARPKKENECLITTPKTTKKK